MRKENLFRGAIKKYKKAGTILALTVALAVPYAVYASDSEVPQEQEGYTEDDAVDQQELDDFEEGQEYIGDDEPETDTESAESCQEGCQCNMAGDIGEDAEEMDYMDDVDEMESEQEMIGDDEQEYSDYE